MQTNSAAEQNKNVKIGPRVRVISPVGGEKVYGGTDLKNSIGDSINTAGRRNVSHSHICKK